jgi:hypothetical protein
MTTQFRPVAPPQIIEGAYSEDQHRRMLNVVRENGPWSLILAQHFKSPEEVVATTSGSLPDGFKPTWDMFLSPVFRGYFAQGSTVQHPEIEDCFFCSTFKVRRAAATRRTSMRPASAAFRCRLRRCG